MTNTRGLDDFFHYYNNDWNKRSENTGRSFTYGACFYDGVKERHLDIDDLGFEYDIDESIINESGCNKEWLDYLDGSVKIELVDFSLLSELIDEVIEQAQEEQQEEFFDFLDDDGPYKTREDLENEVINNLGDYEYIDKTLGNICNDYEDDRGIDYKEQLFDNLDSYTFVSEDEIIGAIQEYYYPEDEGEEPSMGELSEYGELAEEYIADRGLEFEEEENN